MAMAMAPPSPTSAGILLVHEEGNARGVLYRIFERRRYALIVVELLLHDLLFIEHVLSRTCGYIAGKYEGSLPAEGIVKRQYRN